ncbi:MAG: YkgJ family cysteine cluster protein [Lachnospiraceae bacterium]|nr:YkgJ family cysteine cluster protein [Lachnospiraceae bacterium]
MIREVSLEEISDGKLYTANDMVKAECGGCKDCSACCRGMGNTIVLDPFDICRLNEGLGTTTEQLIADGRITLGVIDDIILPSLAMTGADERCTFLDENGRCSIHAHRPGICRLFPLGRYYDETGFKYFLQTGECSNTNRTKVKVKKWLDTPQIARYEHFIQGWHDLLSACRKSLKNANNELWMKTVSMTLLKTFYMTPYKGETEFYEEFEKRAQAARQELGV